MSTGDSPFGLIGMLRLQQLAELDRLRALRPIYDEDAERRAFENWYEGHVMPLEHSNWFKRDGDGDYEIDNVGSCWDGWKARAQR